MAVKQAASWKNISPCLFAVFVDILGFALTLPVFTIIFTSGDFFPSSVSESSRLAYLSIGLALYPLFMFFGSSFMGDLSDIIGRKKVLLMCMSGFIVGFCLMGVGSFSRSLSWLFIGRGLTGLMAASLATTLAAISDMSTPSNKAANMSLVVFMQCIGLVLGPLMGGVLLDSSIVSFFNPSLPFYASAFLSLIALVWIAVSYADTRNLKAHKKMHPLRIILVFIEVAKHKRIRLLTMVFFLQQVGIALFMQLILLYLRRQFEYTGFMMGMYNVFFGGITCVGVLLVPLLAKKFRIEWIACFTAGLMGISQILMVFAGGPVYYVWIVGALVAIFGIITWTGILTSFSNAASGNAQGWALGITGSIVSLSFLLTGFSPNLVPLLGVPLLIELGGIGVLVACGIFVYYCRHRLPAIR